MSDYEIETDGIEYTLKHSSDVFATITKNHAYRQFEVIRLIDCVINTGLGDILQNVKVLHIEESTISPWVRVYLEDATNLVHLKVHYKDVINGNVTGSKYVRTVDFIFDEKISNTEYLDAIKQKYFPNATTFGVLFTESYKKSTATISRYERITKCTDYSAAAIRQLCQECIDNKVNIWEVTSDAKMFAAILNDKPYVDYAISVLTNNYLKEFNLLHGNFNFLAALTKKLADDNLEMKDQLTSIKSAVKSLFTLTDSQ